MACGQWCLIESDPGVFTELIREYGCTGVEVQELYDLEEQLLDQLKPIHGLIFLFKYSLANDYFGKFVLDRRMDAMFFANQVIQNACATQAILSILLNCSHPHIQLGPELSAFKEFTKRFDPPTKGLALSNAELIRKVHNSFSRPQMFEVDEQMRGVEEEDVFHFVSFIPLDGRVYELDGMKHAPMDHGPILPGEDWLTIVKPILQQRMQKFAQGEIRFNLMAVVSDRKMLLEKRLQELTDQQNMETDVGSAEIEEVKQMITREENKWQLCKKENLRRRHNFLPFIMELLKVMAKEGQLTLRVKQAAEKAEKRRAEKLKRKVVQAAGK